MTNLITRLEKVERKKNTFIQPAIGEQEGDISIIASTPKPPTWAKIVAKQKTVYLNEDLEDNHNQDIFNDTLDTGNSK